MSDFAKILYYDLKLEALKGRLEGVVGREDEMARMSRVCKRQGRNNCLIAGPSGIGKTALVRGWVAKTAAESGSLPVVQLESESFNMLNSSGTVPLAKYQQALGSLPECVLFLDNFGRLVYNKPASLNYLTQLLQPLAENPQVRLLLAMEQKELKWLESQQPNFLNFFEILQLKPQSQSELLQILKQALARLRQNHSGTVGENIFNAILQLCQRFASLGQLPASAIGLLDESLALAQAEGQKVVGQQHVYRVAADKTGVPLRQLAGEKQMLKNLGQELTSRIVGQKPALQQIVKNIQRAKLGLKNPNQPLGSFLMLGPSGVGKTETAKLVAEKVFGRRENFTRIDMSEFGQEHTVARLIGAPAGYVGFEAGGFLTNAVKQEPYSLILLDEIEKAHSKIFDVFLQILDDGRLTSGQGETADFTQTIIMATSNLAVEEIIEGFGQNRDIHNPEFLQTRLLPALAKHFRLEFLNRFDAILVFNPLSENDLLEIAKLEIKKVEARVAVHKIRFNIDPAVLKNSIQKLADPRFGARPVKRFVETTCENLITEKLLSMN